MNPISSFSCPNCGAEVPARALVCPECGSDENTGWSEDTRYDGLDLPEEGYGKPQAKTQSSDSVGKKVVAVILLVAFLLLISGLLVGS